MGIRVREILINDIFNKWTVIDPTIVKKGRMFHVMCRCECGLEKLVDKNKLLRHEVKSCGNCSIVGQTFGFVKVLSELGRGKQPTLCTCECVCGKIFETIKTCLKQGQTKSCGCKKAYFISNAQNSQHNIYDTEGNLKGDLVSPAYYRGINYNAKNRNIVFDLDFKSVNDLLREQDSRCVYTKRLIECFNRSTNTASLDRIDSSKGYIKGNVQWTHKDINEMKMELSNEEFFYYCKAVAFNKPILPYVNYDIKMDSKDNTIQSFMTVIGFQMVERKDGERENYAVCKCVCGKVIVTQQGNLRRSNGTKSCGCKMDYLRYKSSKSRINCFDETGILIPSSVNSMYVRGVENRARRRDLEFEVDFIYVSKLFDAQDGKCALSGLPIVCDKEKGNTASLDRIDSKKGYVVGNVQWTHRQVNIMKQELDEEEFRNNCLLIIKNMNLK